MLRLASPVVLAELGWITLGLVDTIMVGRLGAAPLGAVSIGSALFSAVMIFGIGMLLGLDFKISHAWGAGDLRACLHYLRQGVLLAFLLSIPLSLISFAFAAWMPWFGIQQAVLGPAQTYLAVVTWALMPLLLYAAMRRYLQARGVVVPLAVTLVVTNVINIFANWVLIFGKLGMPALGSTGAAYATILAAGCMFAGLLLVVIVVERRERAGLFQSGWRPDRTAFAELSRLGLPAAMQILLEVGVFTAVTILAGRLAPSALAAHHIVLKIASVTFMVPLGVSAAGAVRVGQALGRNAPADAVTSGWMALLIGSGFMALSGMVLLLFPEPIIQIFTTDRPVIDAALTLILIAALFQLFDGIQVVATGVLRGTGDTRTAMIVNLIGHWAIGMPMAWILCFWLSWGAVGLWSGLCAGLVLVAIVLLAFWRRRVSVFRQRDGFSSAEQA